MIGPFAGDLDAPVTRQTMVGADSIQRADFDRMAAVVARRVREQAAADGIDPAAVDVAWSDTVGWMSDAIWLRIRARLYGQRFESLVVRYPADWWQAVRQRFAPAWWLRRHPVVEVVREFTPRVVYPQLRVAAPNQAHVLNIDAATYRTDQVADEDGG